MNRLANRFFHHKEISSKENFYTFIDRKKVVTFVPFDFLEKLTLRMSQAGAGTIGNYMMCSFRAPGVGTFMPNEKAVPFSGNKNKLSFAEEIKLEMECNSVNLNLVIDALLKNHPYEEVAYEIYDFKKRDKKPCGIIVELKTKLILNNFVNRLNQKIDLGNINLNSAFNKIAILNSDLDERIFESAKFVRCEYLLVVFKNTYKLFKL